VICAPKPEEELPGELGHRRIGRRLRGHGRSGFSHRIVSYANDVRNSIICATNYSSTKR
jgi:hypothetical protein